jgi:hypothetical protein
MLNVQDKRYESCIRGVKTFQDGHRQDSHIGLFQVSSARPLVIIGASRPEQVVISISPLFHRWLDNPATESYECMDTDLKSNAALAGLGAAHQVQVRYLLALV